MKYFDNVRNILFKKEFMSVKVKLLGGEEYEIETSYDTTCEQLKNKIKDIVGFMPAEQILVFNKIELSNPNEKLMTHGIKNGSVIKLRFKLKNFTVIVATQDSKSINISVSEEDTVKSLKDKIPTSWNIPIEQQTLVFRDEILENNKKLSDYRIDEECLINLILRVPDPTKNKITKPKQIELNSNVQLDTFSQNNSNQIQIIVQVGTGRNIAVKVNLKECISDLKSKIQQRLNTEGNYLTLVYQGDLLQNEKKLDYYEIEEHSVIIVHHNIKAMDKMKIFARSLDGQAFAFYVAKCGKIIDIKNNIHRKWQIHPDDQKLIFGGAILWDDNENIVNYQIYENSVIQVVPRMRY